MISLKRNLKYHPLKILNLNNVGEDRRILWLNHTIGSPLVKRVNLNMCVSCGFLSDAFNTEKTSQDLLAVQRATEPSQ